MRVCASRPADFPERAVRPSPVVADEPATIAEHPLRVAVELVTMTHELSDCIDDFAVDIELELLGGGVSDSHRTGAAEAGEMGQLALAARRPAIDVVEHMQLGVGEASRMKQPIHERRRLVEVSQL